MTLGVVSQRADVSVARTMVRAYESAQAAVTEQHRPSGVNNRNLVFLHFWRLKSKISVSAGLVCGETSLRGLQTAAFSLCPSHGLSLVCCAPGVSSSSPKDTSPVGSGPHPDDLSSPGLSPERSCFQM